MMGKYALNQINYFVLHKQHLADESKTDDILQIVEDIGGLHATGATAPYLSLLARTRNFKKGDLEKELYVDKNLGKIRCMRKTVFVLPKKMIPIAHAATKKNSELMSTRYAENLGMTQEKSQETSKLVLEILKGRGMTVKEIRGVLQTNANISAVINLMCDQGLLVRGVPPGGWRSNIHTYYRFSEYFPDIDLNELDEAKARELLVRQYLASFGPVTENDIAWWTGFPKKEIQNIMKSLEGQIKWVEISGMKGAFAILFSDLKVLRSVERREEHLVNLLPSLDPYLMGYKDRDRYLSRDNYEMIFDRSGNCTSTILLDGRVIGIWDFVKDKVASIKLFLLKEVEKQVLREIYLEAEKTGRFIADKEVQVKECNSMVPLIHRTAGGVMSPLKGC